MAKWAKLIEVDGEQVLFYLEPDGDDMELHQVVNKDDIFMDLKLTFPNDVKDNSRKVFDMINEESAAKIMAMRDGMLGGSPLDKGEDDADDK